ncbi:caspase-3-like [Ornithodoros turicata]|uniref:caspase-3-like n=1 Tax=Ornithodoros turicata TaxID=34597 RepID=UPI00313A262C
MGTYERDSRPLVQELSVPLPSNDYVNIIEALSETEKRQFAFLLYSVSTGLHKNSLCEFVNQPASIEVLISALRAAPVSKDTLVREILYIMKKFALLRKEMHVCKRHAGLEFRQPKVISEFWKSLAQFCNECLDEEAKKIYECLLPNQQMMSWSSEAVLLDLIERGIIQEGDVSKLRDCLQKDLEIHELRYALNAATEKNYYSMTHSPHGRAVILNHNSFIVDPENLALQLGERRGSKKDVADLEKLWRDFDFSVSVLNDLTLEDIEKVLRQVLDEASDASDAFVLVILSHGFNGGFYTHDSKKCSLERIEQILCDETEALLNKPKIICVQACQVEDFESASEQGRSPGPVNSTNKSKSAMGRADRIKFMSTIPNHVSYRDPENGSIFIQHFIKVLRKYWNECSLQDMGTMINNEVRRTPILVRDNGEELEWKDQVSEVSYALTKNLYLKMR